MSCLSSTPWTLQRAQWRRSYSVAGRGMYTSMILSAVDDDDAAVWLCWCWWSEACFSAVVRIGNDLRLVIHTSERIQWVYWRLTGTSLESLMRLILSNLTYTNQTSPWAHCAGNLLDWFLASVPAAPDVWEEDIEQMQNEPMLWLLLSLFWRKWWMGAIKTNKEDKRSK